MKKILLVVCALMLAVPSKAVLNEKNLDEALVVAAWRTRSGHQEAAAEHGAIPSV